MVGITTCFQRWEKIPQIKYLNKIYVSYFSYLTVKTKFAKKYTNHVPESKRTFSFFFSSIARSFTVESLQRFSCHRPLNARSSPPPSRHAGLFFILIQCTISRKKAPPEIRSCSDNYRSVVLRDKSSESPRRASRAGLDLRFAWQRKVNLFCGVLFMGQVNEL